ncbi:hypothetical protein Tco_0795965 [Tanacetum coccineum]
MRELREDTFFGNKNEDSHDHVDRVLNIIDSLQELSTLGTSLKRPLSKGIIHHPRLLNDLKTSTTSSKKATNQWTINEAPSSSTRQCKVVNADHEMPNIPISSKERTIEVLQCKLPPKEQNPGNFTLPCTIGDFNFYAMANLGDSVNVMPSENSHDNKPRPMDYTFGEWMMVKAGHTNLNESVKKALLKSWVIDCFEEALDPDKDPMERSFDDYKWVFDMEIEQLANEYELGIGKKGHILEMI